MASDARPDGATIIAMTKGRKRRGLLYRLIGVLLVVAAVAGVLVWRSKSKGQSKYEYVTAPVKTGDLRETVTATGTLKGLDSVDVGAQISGRVAKVYVDFNDKVSAGQVLAEIDPESLKNRVEQSRAQVRSADSSVALAKATAAQSKAQLQRVRELNAKGLASSKDLEAAQADATRAEASVTSAQAQATLSRASMKDSQTQLGYTTIKSPIDGIVLARLVEPGQTVAASLQSPVLFTIARDLTQLQLFVDVDEADVGRVIEAQDATFAVDAWAGKTFRSKVVSVHNLPTAGQTVVTYQAVLSVDNSGKMLRPGMTATATIITSEKKGIVLVPNAALRFKPPDDKSSTESSGRGGSSLPIPGMRGGFGRGGGQRPAGAASGQKPAQAPNQSRGTVYVLEGQAPNQTTKALRIQIGGTDGQFTEVLKGLEADQAVITDVEQKEAS
jgi:HlyD family secretion protein